MWSAFCAERWDCALAREGFLGLDFIPLLLGAQLLTATMRAVEGVESLSSCSE
jgi:hypothetical protein